MAVERTSKDDKRQCHFTTRDLGVAQKHMIELGTDRLCSTMTNEKNKIREKECEWEKENNESKFLRKWLGISFGHSIS